LAANIAVPTSLPDYFDLYGLAPGFHPDANAVRKRFYELSRQHHPDRAGGGDAAAQIVALQLTAQVNEGYRLFRNPDALMGYILKRERVVEEEEAYQLPPDFLMEMMDLNETIVDAKTAPDMQSEAERQAAAAFGEWETSANPLMERYDGGERSPELLAALKDAYYRRKYLLRIQEQLRS
jgi:molecular chaperone HscB